MPELSEIPGDTALDAPAGRYGGEVARAWQHVAYRAVAHRLTQAITACAEAAELAGSAASQRTPGQPTDTDEIVDRITRAEQALDAAHELAYEASGPSEAYCAMCGEPIGILASAGTDWEHWEQRPDPVTGRLRNQVLDMRHRPVPAWRPRNRPAIIAGRIVSAED